jgi:hypothetical protein
MKILERIAFICVAPVLFPLSILFAFLVKASIIPYVIIGAVRFILGYQPNIIEYKDWIENFIQEHIIMRNWMFRWQTSIMRRSNVN